MISKIMPDGTPFKKGVKVTNGESVALENKLSKPLPCEFMAHQRLQKLQIKEEILCINMGIAGMLMSIWESQ